MFLSAVCVWRRRRQPLGFRSPHSFIFVISIPNLVFMLIFSLILKISMMSLGLGVEVKVQIEEIEKYSPSNLGRFSATQCREFFGCLEFTTMAFFNQSHSKN